MTQESIFIVLIGLSRSKFQDFEARILVLTSNIALKLDFDPILPFFLTGKCHFLTEKWPEKWAFLTKCSSDSDSARRELSFRYGLASSGAHGAELWRFFIISKKLFKNGLLRQFCRQLQVGWRFNHLVGYASLQTFGFIKESHHSPRWPRERKNVSSQ